MSRPYEKYVRSWKRKIEADKRRQESRAAEAMKVACTAARILAAEFGVRRVVLFGSLARGKFGEDSDIDIGVVGLRSPDYFKAAARVEEGHDFEVNLVPYEAARDHIKKSMEEGQVLFEKEDGNGKNRTQAT